LALPYTKATYLLTPYRKRGKGLEEARRTDPRIDQAPH
jgi:hypothetical protein